jgi:hypothetical protein
MNSYHDRLVGEIEERLNALQAHAKLLDAQAIALDICGSHKHALSDDEHGWFWQWNGYQNVRDMVRQRINKRVGSDDPTPRAQIVLPGFERDRLQDYYTVSRDGAEVHVPVVDLTDDEIEAKAEEKRKMGAACYAHADELMRFKRWRREANVIG